MNRKSKLQEILILANKETVSTYSSVMRDLNKEKNFEKRMLFMKTFKKAFDEAMNQSLDDPQNVALLKALQEIDA